jgi:hypothetical protein
MATITAEFTSSGAEVRIEVTSSDLAQMVDLEEQIRKFLISLLNGANSNDKQNVGESTG